MIVSRETLYDFSIAMNFLVIAIDGPSGVGKSTLSRLLAERLGGLYVDTGAMFRCLAWRWQQLNFTEEEEELINLGAKTQIKMSSSQIWCNETDVSEVIRSEKVSELSSSISRFPVIRDIMKQKQRQLVEDVRISGTHSGAVLEGRDIGTVVFPNAELKFFVDASPEIRAQRRVDQLRQKGEEANYKKVFQGLKERDTKDRSRTVAPLLPAKDAIMIDTDEMGIQEVLETMYRYAEPYN